VIINPPWEMADEITRHFESCRHTTPTSTMAVYVLPKLANFNEFIRLTLKMYREFHARTQWFTRCL
jgi:hypothetical protein